MTTTLFIKANDRPIEGSISVKLYHAFLESYKLSQPDDRVIELDLYAVTLPYLNAAMINGNFKSAQGAELTSEEKRLSDIANRFLEQFLNADKLVIGFPLWNLTVPAVLHSYFDYLHRPGKTFKYTDQGSVGLLSDKKVAILNARGGVYEAGNRFEMAVNFVQNQLNFLGINNMTTIVIEGHHEFPKRSEAIIAEGLEKATEVAKTF